MDADPVGQVARTIEIKPGTTANGWGLKFDESGQNIRAELYIIQWRDGKLITVFPKGPSLMDPIMATPCCKK